MEATAATLIQYHYSRMGVRIAPDCADGEGYIHIRPNYDELARADWTDSEDWTFRRAQKINCWRQAPD